MLISIYTCVKDGLFYDYHLVDMLRHHLPLADEIVVNEGFSSDGTYERICSLDPKIKVFRSDWGKPSGGLAWITRFKNEARLRCRAKWCILLDCDEFIPEWEFDSIRNRLGHSDETMLGMRMLNFYGNYRVYHPDPDKIHWPSYKINFHRNVPEIEVWGDGSHVRLQGTAFGGRDLPMPFHCHHFGVVRHPGRLRQKWRLLGGLYANRRRWFKLPSFLFDLRPHDWMDPQFLGDLAIYDGPFVQAVRENPEEFVRDDFRLYDYLAEQVAKETQTPVAT